MKIGIVSDSHGKTDRLRRAVELFASRGVEAIVHCGDILSAECIELLGDATVSAYVVVGNMDRHVDSLAATAKKRGVHFGWETIELPLANGEYLIATHGHDDKLLNELIAGGQFPYVCFGHTHRPGDKRLGRVRVINPGALRHPRRPHRPTVAVLDTDTDTLDLIEVGR
ncbi:MAG: YfcE family phosphodiesterase [Planctomycetota bacterium]|nr:YfcE family phosphodiesterase [Planctomycetota bacterium]